MSENHAARPVTEHDADQPHAVARGEPDDVTPLGSLHADLAQAERFTRSSLGRRS